MNKNILVTGSHRSGTTWVGKIISEAKKVRYAHEPFNIGIKRKHSPFTYWFENITDDNSTELKIKVKDYIDSFSKVFELNNCKKFTQIRTLKSLSHYFKDVVSCLYSERTVIKDPIAIMSAEWLYNNLDVDVVVLIRHPAAFVSSLKVKDWQFDFNNYLSQDSLINNYLKDYEELIVEYSKNKKDIIDQGILLWNTIHVVIEYYKSKYGEEWYFVKHEDLSLHPHEEFKKIFSKIDLNFSCDVEDYINETTLAKVDLDVVNNSTEVSNIKRNSVENIKSWKKRLSDDEIQRIKIGTEEVWKKFYVENDW
jgi:hypothetical protein